MTGTASDRAFFEQASKDPAFLLSSIDEALMRADVEDLPIVTLSGTGEEAAVSSVEAGVPRHRVIDQIVENKRSLIVALICDKGCYCDFKRRHKDTIDIMAAVMDSMLSGALRFPVPLTMIAAYCVRSLTLDRLCGCPQD